jgi:hypothetical protein
MRHPSSGEVDVQSGFRVFLIASIALVDRRPSW